MNHQQSGNRKYLAKRKAATKLIILVIKNLLKVGGLVCHCPHEPAVLIRNHAPIMVKPFPKIKKC